MAPKTQLAKVGFGMIKTLNHLQNKWISAGVIVECINDALNLHTDDSKVKTTHKFKYEYLISNLILLEINYPVFQQFN